MNEIPDILKEGKTLANVYSELKNKLVQFQKLKNLDFELQKSFGHGIGLEFKEKLLDINETNNSKIKPLQTYLIFLNLPNLKDKAGTYSLQIMNTYVVSEDIALNLNEKISYKLTDISYTFEDESEEDDDKELIEESKTGER